MPSALTPALAADYMDTLAGSGRVQGPWADVYKTAMKKRVTAWFAELKRIGGEVDLVLSDFEMGFHSASYNWAHQPTADGSDPVDALLADPRWPALQAQLNHAGAPFGVNFSTASMRTMAEWHQRDWRMTVWGRVVPTLYVAGLLNASVFAPIAASFPAVRFSNFAHSHHTDPSGVVSPSSLGTIWAEAEVVIGLGAHVGTHQSTAFCKHFPFCGLLVLRRRLQLTFVVAADGTCNSSRVFAFQTPGPAGRQVELAASSFNSLLAGIVRARDMYRAAPTVPIHPWLAPKHADWGKGSSWLASGNQSTDEVRMWEENVFHLALSTGATEFLWWQPGAQRPLGVGQALLSAVLHELDAVTGLAGRAGCTVTPLVTNQTAVEDFGRTWLLSGARVSCHGGHERDVYRFTPREYSRVSPRCLLL